MALEHNLKQAFERVYEKPGAVWTVKPDEEVIKKVENKIIKPGEILDAIDLGCGEGTYSIYLASRGMNVTAVDYIDSAVEYAKDNLEKSQEVNIKDIDFLVMDLLGDLKELKGKKFDFALDWAVLHHIMPGQRGKYMENLLSMIKDGGKLISFSFDLISPCFDGGNKQYRKGSTGVEIYYATQEELGEYFSPYFKNLSEPKTIKWFDGKKNLHIGNFLFMEKI